MKFMKLVLIGVGSLVLVMFLISKCNSYNSQIMEDAFWEDHPNLKNTDFKDLSVEDKTVYLKQFIRGERIEPFSSQAARLETILKKAFLQSVKFPETLEFKSPLGWGDFAGFAANSTIEDPENGILVSNGVYRAENKLGMKVQGNYSIKYKFDGKGFEFLDATID